MTIIEQVKILNPKANQWKNEDLQNLELVAKNHCDENFFNSVMNYELAIAYLICHLIEKTHKVGEGFINSKREGDLSVSFSNWVLEDDLDTTDYGKRFKTLLKLQANGVGVLL